MTFIDPNSSVAADRRLEEEKEMKKARTPPQTNKNFNNLVDSKKQQASQMESEEFVNISEEYEAYTPPAQKYTPVKITPRQAAAISRLSSESEETSEVKKKIEEAADLNARNIKRSKVKQEFKQQARADQLTSKNVNESTDSESITVDLSPEELKELQSFIQKNSKNQEGPNKELLNQLSNTLKTAETAAKTAPATTQVTDNPSFKSQNKIESPPSPMQALAQTVSPKSPPAKKQPPLEETVTPKNVEVNQSVTSKNTNAQPTTANEMEPDLAKLDSNLKAQTTPPKQTPKTAPADVSKVDTTIENEELPATPKVAGGGNNMGQITEGKAAQNRVNQEATVKTDKVTDPNLNPELPVREQTPKNSSEQRAVASNVASTTEKVLPEKPVDKKVENLANPVDTSKAQPTSTENRPIENLLNSRFSSKKEVTEVPQTQKNQPVKIDMQAEATSSAKQSEISSVQGKPIEGAQPTEIKSSRKTKESELKSSTEAEVSSASSVSPVVQGVEGSVQLQPDRQEFSRESITQLIKELVDQILIIRTEGQTDTLVTLRSPKILEGATIKISTYDQARGEVNITFANLTPEAKKLLDSNLARDSLTENLKDRSNIIVHNIVTTTQAETPYILPQKQVREDQEKEGRREQEDNEQ